MSKNTFPITEALNQLLDQSDLWRRTGRPMRQRISFKSTLKVGGRFPLNFKMQLLDEAGFKLKIEAIWQHPDEKPAKPFTIVKGQNCKKRRN